MTVKPKQVRGKPDEGEIGRRKIVREIWKFMKKNYPGLDAPNGENEADWLKALGRFVVSRRDPNVDDPPGVQRTLWAARSLLAIVREDRDQFPPIP